jgi:hypothetical protein
MPCGVSPRLLQYRQSKSRTMGTKLLRGSPTVERPRRRRDRDGPEWLSWMFAILWQAPLLAQSGSTRLLSKAVGDSYTGSHAKECSYASFKACAMSAIRSGGCSIPIDSRIVESRTPIFWRTAITLGP